MNNYHNCSIHNVFGCVFFLWPTRKKKGKWKIKEMSKENNKRPLRPTLEFGGAQ